MSTRLAATLSISVARLPPASFGVVMATGIVSDATRLLGLVELATLLVWINVGIYGILTGLSLSRLLGFGRLVGKDLRDPTRAPGALTFVVGSCVVGSNLAILTRSALAAAILWFIAIIVWVVLVNATFVLLATRPEKRGGLSKSFDGNWFLLGVAAEALAVTGAVVAAHSATARELALACALIFFLLGSIFYVGLFTLLLYRLLFLPLTPEAITPSYWISMGAAAIASFAGALLARGAASSPLLTALYPLTLGMAVFFWAVASWWIPPLVILGIWRHLRHHLPIRYNAQYWAIVFPLGMYAVASFQLFDDVGWRLLLVLGHIFAYAALASWALATMGLVRAVARAVSV